MKISIAGFDLAKGGREGPQGFSVNGQRVVQAATFLRGDASRQIARGNRTTTIGFAVARGHNTIQDAERFCLEHELDVPDSGLIILTAGEGATTVSRFLTGCVVSVESDYEGVMTVTRYTLVGGKMLKIKPTT